MEINFKINNKCNLNCDYCLWKSGPNYDSEKCIETLKAIKELYKFVNDKTNSFYIHGGESTIHKDFKKIFENFELENIPLELQTNATFKESNFILDKFERISVSVHFKELRKKNLWNLFLENLEKIVSKNRLYHLDIMLENFDDCTREQYLNMINQILPFQKYAVFSEMIYNYWDISDSVSQETRDFNFEIYKKYNSHSQSYKWPGQKQKLNTNENWLNCESSKGFYCLAGCKKFHIFGNGEVYKCASHETQGISKYNNIQEDGIKDPLCNILCDFEYLKSLTTKYQKCEFNYCGGDFYVPRAKSIEKLKILENLQV